MDSRAARAIDYVEAHMTEEIDFEQAAKQAYASSFHFQRVFGICAAFRWAIISACAGFPWPEELAKGQERLLTWR
ncbi:MAG: hypothetical protein ACLT0Y_04915 [Christensenellales bacterium]